MKKSILALATALALAGPARSCDFGFGYGRSFAAPAAFSGGCFGGFGGFGGYFAQSFSVPIFQQQVFQSELVVPQVPIFQSFGLSPAFSSFQSAPAFGGFGNFGYGSAFGSSAFSSSFALRSRAFAAPPVFFDSFAQDSFSARSKFRFSARGRSGGGLLGGKLGGGGLLGGRRRGGAQESFDVNVRFQARSRFK